MKKKIQILVPQYKETDEIIKPLLDSIMIQQNVNLKDIGVIICNDGTDVKLTREFLDSYPYDIEYYDEPHRGVSGTRNACLDHSKADYVMFCDADDMFYNACGIYIIFREIDGQGFDGMISLFIEESRDPNTKIPVYINHEMDSTFVHGKVYRRQYLIDNKIRWNDNLTIHEDSYFNCLAQKCSEKIIYCQSPFYLWKWRDESVCRHDPKYILKTYNNMLDSNTALVGEFINRKQISDAQFYSTMMIYDAYFTMNKDEWINQENKEYRDATEKRFYKYYMDFEHLFNATDKNIKAQIIMNLKNRMFQEGLLMESITFDDWIEGVKQKYGIS